MAVLIENSTLSQQHNHSAVTIAGLLVALGIIFGDIGTSPLYVMKAIVGNRTIDEHLILGGLSCVFWTLTLQTTIKYVILTLRADNNGEGGIFSLYALVRKQGKWLLFPAILGGSTLLADGIITPSISIASAVEGLLVINPDIPTVPIVIFILTILFFLQQFGTTLIGRAFGPIMFIWFSMLMVLGLGYAIQYPSVFKALNPFYAFDFLINYPGAFWLLGAVFLCTTGAEALYSDLGHCGRGNIRISWIYVKTALFMNYLGQGAYLLSHNGEKLNGNPFYLIMPDWFLIPGIVIATLATIIASQALISGSFTLISEAILLNLWPKSRIKYPSDIKGQLYIPSINRLLWVGCVFVMLYFQKSEHMEAAYGLAITLTMLMTTVLLFNYLKVNKYSPVLSYGALIFFLSVEFGFLFANIHKFPEGGWISLAISMFLFFVMYVWYGAGVIKRRYTEFIPFDGRQREMLKALSTDETVPKFATHLVYLTSAESKERIEWKTFYSIFRKQPKRADLYWFIHVTTLDEPHTMEYKAEVLADDDIVWIEFRLGFRVQPRINLFFRKAVEDLVKRNEVILTSRYPSLQKYDQPGDFRFVVIERYLSYGVEFPLFQKFILESYFLIKKFTLTEGKSFGLDTSSVTVEKIPLTIPNTNEIRMTRVFDDKDLTHKLT